MPERGVVALRVHLDLKSIRSSVRVLQRHECFLTLYSSAEFPQQNAYMRIAEKPDLILASRSHTVAGLCLFSLVLLETSPVKTEGLGIIGFKGIVDNFALALKLGSSTDLVIP